jgi:hypothetical protein
MQKELKNLSLEVTGTPPPRPFPCPLRYDPVRRDLEAMADMKAFETVRTEVA